MEAIDFILWSVEMILETIEAMAISKAAARVREEGYVPGSDAFERRLHHLLDEDVGSEISRAIASSSLQTRMRWWADFNSWKVPDDFPVKLPELESHRDKAMNPRWAFAWNRLNAYLSVPQTSLAWWLFGLGKTAEEWREWYISNMGSGNPAAADMAIAEFRAQTG